jgi:hypothetical protein
LPFKRNLQSYTEVEGLRVEMNSLRDCVTSERRSKEAALRAAARERVWCAHAREDAAAAASAAGRLAGGMAAELRLVRVTLDADRTMPRADRSAAAAWGGGAPRR